MNMRVLGRFASHKTRAVFVCSEEEKRYLKSISNNYLTAGREKKPVKNGVRSLIRVSKLDHCQNRRTVELLFTCLVDSPFFVCFFCFVCLFVCLLFVFCSSSKQKPEW